MTWAVIAGVAQVLDLMVRMLGFTEEDKQRIGLAQQVASKGVVRGVLGLPGRLVGGIMGSGPSEASPPVPSENQVSVNTGEMGTPAMTMIF